MYSISYHVDRVLKNMVAEQMPIEGKEKSIECLLSSGTDGSYGR